jgi:hypothetical protein
VIADTANPLIKRIRNLKVGTGFVLTGLFLSGGLVVRLVSAFGSCSAASFDRACSRCGGHPHSRPGRGNRCFFALPTRGRSLKAISFGTRPSCMTSPIGLASQTPRLHLAPQDQFNA